MTPGARYAVELKVEIAGRMVVPDGKEPAKDKTPRVITVSGASTLKYDERVLPADDADADKVARVYRTVDIRRTVGGGE